MKIKNPITKGFVLTRELGNNSTRWLLFTFGYTQIPTRKRLRWHIGRHSRLTHALHDLFHSWNNCK